MKHRLFVVFAALLALAAISPVFGQDATQEAAASDAALPAVLTLPEQIAEGRDVTITVSNMPSSDQADLRAAWEAQVARFTAMYPNVTIEGNEIEYDPAAFVALAAADELPTLFMTYFTEPSKFIPEGVVADITPYVQAAGVADVYNPAILSLASDGEAIYGMPLNAYALGLAYNKSLLEAAGYDAPPSTWEELAEMAPNLTDREAGVAGFAFINDGGGATGWHFTDIAYGFGATREDIIVANEDGTFTAAYGDGPTVDALNYIKSLRWEGDALPAETFDWGTLSEALMSGRIAMAIYAGDQFNFSYFQFPDADLNNFGFAPIPEGPNGRIALTGGNLWMVSASATDDQKEAATYFQLWRQFDPAEVKASLDATQEAVGAPSVPLYVGDYQAAWEAFRAPYNKLPVENYALYNEAIKNGDVTLQPEPVVAIQDYYTEVGIVVSEVLSNESVDVAARLQQSAEEFQSFVLDALPQPE